MMEGKAELPPFVHSLLQVLILSGHQAYLVGGAVRDLQLGRPPKDYDIATGATPEKVAVLAKAQGWRVVEDLGRNFGVVVVVVDGQAVEVTTFRGERYGADSHRPDAVWYAKTIEEDLARRDFTINAMALDVYGQLIDPFGGAADAAAGFIRAVGEPAVRFKEDALRLFRACRFAAELGFTVEPATRQALSRCTERVAGLSLERVRGELERIILAERCDLGMNLMLYSGLLSACCRQKVLGEYRLLPILPEVQHLAGLAQNPIYHRYDAWEHTLLALRLTPPEPALRWSALLHDCGKGLPGIREVDAAGRISDHGHQHMSAEMADEALRRLQVPERLRRRVCWLVSRHMRLQLQEKMQEKTLQRWLREEARSGCFKNTGEMVDAFRQLVALGMADSQATGYGAHRLAAAQNNGEQVIAWAARMPVHTADLAYVSYELKQLLGGRPQLMGSCLRSLLQRVQDGSLPNEKQALEKAALRWSARQV